MIQKIEKIKFNTSIQNCKEELIKTYELTNLMFGKGIPIKKRVPFDLQRKVAAFKTVEAWENIPHAGVILDLDVTDILTFISELKKDPELSGVRITFNAVMLKLIAMALIEAPELNSYVSYDKNRNTGEILILDDVNMAIPVILEDGRTITPVLRQVDKKSIKEICLDMENLWKRIKKTNVDLLLFEAGKKDTIEQLKKGHLSMLSRILANFFGKTKLKLPSKAEQKEYAKIPEDERLTTKDILSATILVSNIGSALPEARSVIGLLEIIAPQTSVIGLTAIRKVPTVITNTQGKDEIVIRQILPISVYCDHRSIDFFHGIDFLKKCIEISKNPRKLLEPRI